MKAITLQLLLKIYHDHPFNPLLVITSQQFLSITLGILKAAARSYVWCVTVLSRMPPLLIHRWYNYSVLSDQNCRAQVFWLAASQVSSNVMTLLCFYWPINTNMRHLRGKKNCGGKWLPKVSSQMLSVCRRYYKKMLAHGIAAVADWGRAMHCGGFLVLCCQEVKQAVCSRSRAE